MTAELTIQEIETMLKGKGPKYMIDLLVDYNKGRDNTTRISPLHFRQAFEKAVSDGIVLRGNWDHYRWADDEQPDPSKMNLEPSLKAINGKEYLEFKTLEEKVDALEEIWRDFNGGSSVTKYYHFAYFQIIGLGPVVIPILLKKMKTTGTNAWFVALKAITGISVCKDVQQGDAKAAKEAWIKWGEENGYLVFSKSRIS